MSRPIFVTDTIVSVFSTLSRLTTLGRSTNGGDTSWLADARWLDETEGPEATATAHRFAVQAYSRRDRNGGRYWERVAGELHRIRAQPGRLRKHRDDPALASPSARLGEEAPSTAVIPHTPRADSCSLLEAGTASASENLQDESSSSASAPREALVGNSPVSVGHPVEQGPPPRKSLRLSAREKLFNNGDRSNRIYELTQGTIIVCRFLADGRRQITDIAGPGRLLGLTAAERHDSDAVAVTPASVMVWDRKKFLSTDRAREILLEAAFRDGERLRTLAVALGRKTAIERIASFFVGAAGEAAAISFGLPLTRYDIADHLGLTVETVSRTITKMKTMGMIAEHRGEIRLLDTAGLSLIATGDPRLPHSITSQRDS
ncbi:Crp/Fnr family transcriptional regulator [Pinisolibacter aquiterrae]|jgi:CRP/FNR family transcriptional regulator|uniref:Crp/Fnr family transcriptional regulator n=1 Tax=Pinisolibacter aquiterrae TaxID=2815579 RepID=UPI001C3DBA32|nr:Crp/Fnr family transcriptional regulator [Pinisolibacter aquiterrae]MBV5264257.1 Crp/Fnr family transcriptional regulator [Pinisolibacter aquiterrae]MCC8236158.1 Crp/Fnr family transcriptional regulator [Pinisolibacter aquiterrae]